MEAVIEPSPDDPAPQSLSARIRAAIPPKDELKKLVPLGLMFFCILFNYTILRDTKDVLVVTAPGSSAEVIPFLKTYVNLPGATFFVLAYSALANRLGREALFYSVLTPFLGFFGAFAWIIYPLRDFVHPNAFCDMLAASLPLGFAAPIGVLRNWTYSLFYLLANMWGSVVVSLMFWGFANEITTVTEAKKYYPLFGMGANVALVFSGQFVRYVSQLKGSLPAGVDPWGVALKLLMTAVVASGGVIAACYRYLTVEVVSKSDLSEKSAQGAKKKKKPSMSLGESAKYLASSPYIRNLAALVIAYGMSINLVEVTWKAKLKEQFPDPSAYSAFMGQFSSVTGVTTLAMMFFGRFALRKWGWGVAAQITPAVLLATGAAFFALTLSGTALSPLVALLGTTPLMLAVLVGAAQNIVSKAAKYSLFDPCKEMAFIPLDQEQKTKGKAAIDVIGAPLGKSGGSLIQQVLIFSLGSLAASTPYLAAILTAIIAVWIFAARGLAKQFDEKMKDVQT
uniref:ADP,ATP carrier protein n=1 Tax=Chrysotila carterae TaxID=13221 RepID=A0A7S4EW10_CHRCT